MLEHLSCLPSQGPETTGRIQGDKQPEHVQGWKGALCQHPASILTAAGKTFRYTAVFNCLSKRLQIPAKVFSKEIGGIQEMMKKILSFYETETRISQN